MVVSGTDFPLLMPPSREMSSWRWRTSSPFYVHTHLWKPSPVSPPWIHRMTESWGPRWSAHLSLPHVTHRETEPWGRATFGSRLLCREQLSRDGSPGGGLCAWPYELLPWEPSRTISYHEIPLRWCVHLISHKWGYHTCTHGTNVYAASPMCQTVGTWPGRRLPSRGTYILKGTFSQ